MAEVSRLVEIRSAKQGSGFLIGPGLVLTALHVLRRDPDDPLPSHADVRILGDSLPTAAAGRVKTRHAALLWPPEAMKRTDDFALLRVEPGASELADTFVPWSDLPDAQEISVEVIGFPDFAIFTNTLTDPARPFPERDTFGVTGRVHTGSGLKQRQAYKQGYFNVVLRSEDLPAGKHFAWEGFSGAAVFAGQVLVGVVAKATEVQPGVHHLRTLPVARLFALDGVQTALGEAGMRLPDPAPLGASGQATLGFASELLDRFGVARNAPSEFRAGVEHFLASYLGTSSQRVAFGGRETMLARLDRWLDDPAAAARLLLHAPGGRGKSALVVQWLLVAAKRCRLIFLPISARSATNRPLLFYQALAERLGEILGLEPDASIVDDPVGHYRALATNWLRRLDAKGKPVLLVIDGLDEAAGWQLPPALLPELPTAGLRIVVSARERADDRGAEGWMRQLGWDRGNAEAIPVDPLDEAGVAEVLRSVDRDRAEVEHADIAKQIMRLSGGDTWIVRLYAEDLYRDDGSGGYLRPEDLGSREPGFGPFFHAWLKDQKEIWRHRERPIDDAMLDAVLAILACMFGPLRHDILAEIYRCWRGAGFVLSREALEPIDRFILGDGTTSGYVLAHPKFAEFLRDEYFTDPLMLRKAREAILDWCLNTLSALDAGTLPPASCPPYLLTYLGQHLVDARASVEHFMRLVGPGWLGAWYGSEGGYRGFAQDVRRAADAIEERALADERRWAWRLRCQLVMSSVASVGTRIPGWLIAECVSAGKLTGRQALHLLEQRGLLATPAATFNLDAMDAQSADAKALVALAQAWPQGPERMDGLGEVLGAVGRIGAGYLRAEALTGIATFLPTALMGEALCTALSIDRDEQRAKAVAALVRTAPDGLRAQALHNALVAAGSSDWAQTLEVLAQSLPDELRSEALSRARAEVEARQDAKALAWVLVAATACMPEMGGEALSASAAVADERLRAKMLRALAPRLPESQLPRALVAALEMADIGSRWYAFSILVPRLTGALLTDAVRKVAMWEAPLQRALALGAIVGHVADDQERSFAFTKAVEAVDELQDDEAVLSLLSTLASCAPNESQRTTLLTRALHAIESMADERQRGSALRLIVKDLTAPLFDEALRLLAGIEDEMVQFYAFKDVTPYLPDVLVPKAFEVARAMKREWHRSAALAEVAPKLPADLLGDALLAVGEFADKGGAPALVALVPRLPENLLPQALILALDVPSEVERQQIVGLSIQRMPAQALEKTLAILLEDFAAISRSPWVVDFVRQLPAPLLPAVLSALETVESELTRQNILVAVMPRLPESMLDEARRMVKALSWNDARAAGLTALALRLPAGADREQACADALQAMADMLNSHDCAKLLETLLPRLPTGLLGEALEKIECVSGQQERAHILENVCRYLPEELVPRAWQLAKGMASAGPRAHAMAAVAKRFSTHAERANALEEALRGFMTIDDNEARVWALSSLVPHLPAGDERAEAVAHALQLANSIVDDRSKILALGRLAPYCFEAVGQLLRTSNSSSWDEISEVLMSCQPAVEHSDLLRAMAECVPERERVPGLLALMKRLPEASRREFLLLGLGLEDEGRRADFVRAGAPHFGLSELKDAARAAKGIRNKFQRDWAMKGLKPYLPQPWLARLLQRSAPLRDGGEVEVEESLRAAATFNDLARAQALIRIAPRLPARLSSEALALCASIRQEHWRAGALEAVVQFLPDARKGDALKIAAEIDLAYSRGRAIAGIAPYLSSSLLDEALNVLETIQHDWLGYSAAITGLAPYLGDASLQRAITAASRELTAGEHRVEALTALGSRLPLGAKRTELLSDALITSEAITDAVGRVRSLRLLLPHLPVTLQERAVCALLEAAGRTPRVNLLKTIPVLVAAVEAFRAESTVLSTYRTVCDVGRWFP